jgi:DnaJ-class molecular chaperone
MKEFYSILGVSEKASTGDIKKAYKRLARKYHPDLNPNNKKSESQFKKITEAYETLSNVKKRKTYDSEGSPLKGGGFSEKQGPFYYESQSKGKSRYQDIFGDLFGQGSGFQEEDLSNLKYKGEDYLFRMDVDFGDMVLGSKKQILLPNNKKLEVQIPPGVKHGQKLRFKSQGSPGHNGGINGDMLVEILLRKNDDYKRIGNDLECSLDIPFTTAVLGGKARVSCFDGHVELTIPEDASTGTKLRIKGKGIRIKPTPGDLFVKIRVVIPKNIPKKFKEELVKWKDKIEAAI